MRLLQATLAKQTKFQPSLTLITTNPLSIIKHPATFARQIRVSRESSRQIWLNRSSLSISKDKSTDQVIEMIPRIYSSLESVLGSRQCIRLRIGRSKKVFSKISRPALLGALTRFSQVGTRTLTLQSCSRSISLSSTTLTKGAIRTVTTSLELTRQDLESQGSLTEDRS